MNFFMKLFGELKYYIYLCSVEPGIWYHPEEVSTF